MCPIQFTASSSFLQGTALWLFTVKDFFLFLQGFSRYHVFLNIIHIFCLVLKKTLQMLLYYAILILASLFHHYICKIH
jgi:hypothetical protein